MGRGFIFAGVLLLLQGFIIKLLSVQSALRSVVILDDRFLEREIFLVGDDLLLAGAVEVGELLADAGFVFTVDLGAAETTGEDH